MRLLLPAAMAAALAALPASPASARKGKSPPEGATTYEVTFPPPGSTWSERTVFRNGKSATEIFTAMKNAIHEGRPAHRASAGKLVRILDASTRSLTAIVVSGREVLRFSPHNGAFAPPLWVGKKWKHVMTVIDPVKGERQGPMRIPFEVEALEDVTVPAGTFKALRIRMDGELDGVEGMMTDLIRQTDWFVPGLGLTVKSVRMVNGDHPLGAGAISMEVVSTEGLVTRRMADAGVADAQVEIGLKFDKGLGVEADAAEALSWYRKAAEQGDARALNMLGVVYQAGRGVPQDYGEAVKWYRHSAEKGNANAQFNLGLMYEKGQGVAPDRAEAGKWFTKAAEQGHAAARKRLAPGK